jgi:hypothetical protein
MLLRFGMATSAGMFASEIMLCIQFEFNFSPKTPKYFIRDSDSNPNS